METNKRLTVTPAPHIRTKASTTSIMLDVIIALIPTLIASIYIFGFRALIMVLVAVASCVGAEVLSQKAMKRPIRVSDLSAVVTGLILGLNLPEQMPYWMIIFASVFSIVIVKEMFGGIGNNFINPAAAGRALLLVSWPEVMGNYTIHGVTTATPLSGKPFDLMSMFLGNIPGVMGEVSKVAILIGLVYLLVRGVINIRIPAVYMLTIAVFFLLLGYDAEDTLYQLLAGGALFGAVFMLTDYSSSPTAPLAQIIYAAGAGIITVVIRVWGAFPEGVVFSILLMNVMTPLLDKLVRENTFGKKEAKNE